jgi:hypothetical protein
MAGNFFRGTTAEQDSRWGGDAALIRKLEKKDQFSKAFTQKVQYSTVLYSL